jgi:hypothetical protein
MSIPRSVLRGLMGERHLTAADLRVFMIAWESCPETIAKLAAEAGICRSTAKRSCVALAKAGWMAMKRQGRCERPVAIIPHKLQSKMVEELHRGYAMTPFRGEYLMKAYLNLRINTDEYTDNARPGFLLNPESKEALEYDRYYWAGVAFEFNGPQHYEVTAKYASERQLQKTRLRDLVKRGLSQEAQVSLVVVTTDQLSPATLDTLIPDRLPRRPVDEQGPYYRALVELCQAYMHKARGDRR